MSSSSSSDNSYSYDSDFDTNYSSSFQDESVDDTPNRHDTAAAAATTTTTTNAPQNQHDDQQQVISPVVEDHQHNSLSKERNLHPLASSLESCQSKNVTEKKLISDDVIKDDTKQERNDDDGRDDQQQGLIISCDDQNSTNIESPAIEATSLSSHHVASTHSPQENELKIDDDDVIKRYEVTSHHTRPISSGENIDPIERKITNNDVTTEEENKNGNDQQQQQEEEENSIIGSDDDIRATTNSTFSSPPHMISSLHSKHDDNVRVKLDVAIKKEVNTRNTTPVITLGEKSNPIPNINDPSLTSPLSSLKRAISSLNNAADNVAKSMNQSMALTKSLPDGSNEIISDQLNVDKASTIMNQQNDNTQFHSSSNDHREGSTNVATTTDQKLSSLHPLSTLLPVHCGEREEKSTRPMNDHGLQLNQQLSLKASHGDVPTKLPAPQHSTRLKQQKVPDTIYTIHPSEKKSIEKINSRQQDTRYDPMTSNWLQTNSSGTHIRNNANASKHQDLDSQIKMIKQKYQTTRPSSSKQNHQATAPVSTKHSRYHKYSSGRYVPKNHPSNTSHTPKVNPIVDTTKLQESKHKPHTVKDFLARQEAMEASRKMKQERRKMELVYDNRVDKKKCKYCGNVQSYDEMLEGRDICPFDGHPYEQPIKFRLDQFEKRNCKSNAKRLQIIKEILQERESTRLMEQKSRKQLQLMNKITNRKNFLSRMSDDLALRKHRLANLEKVKKETQEQMLQSRRKISSKQTHQYIERMSRLTDLSKHGRRSTSSLRNSKSKKTCKGARDKAGKGKRISTSKKKRRK